MNGSPLKDVLTRVAEVFGEKPNLVSIRFSNGSRVRIEADGTTTAEEEKITAEDRKRYETWTGRIMPFMREKQMPLLRKQIAMGLKIRNNDTTGWFGKTIVKLVADGVLSESDDGFLSIAGSEQLSEEGDEN